MSAELAPSRRFIRRTDLTPGEYHRKFKQLDDDIIEAITSDAADQVTPLMAKIYLRLFNAPSHYWERSGTLRIEAEFRDGEHVKAWKVLCEMARVSSATLNKALTWMHEQGIIGYFAGKNGVGIRIFFNRAASSIGTRPAHQEKKILPFAPASSGKPAASSDETAFKEPYRDIEISDIDENSRAPVGGAKQIPAGKSPTCTERVANGRALVTASNREREGNNSEICLDVIFKQLQSLIEPCLKSVAAKAAALEHERTRDWLEKRGLPKVARVAQREAYNVLKHHVAMNDSARRACSELTVGSHKVSRYGPKPLTPEEVREVAEICVSMFEAQGQAVDVTLAEISIESGGYLLPEDAPSVRELARSMLRIRNENG